MGPSGAARATDPSAVDGAGADCKARIWLANVLTCSDKARLDALIASTSPRNNSRSIRAELSTEPLPPTGRPNPPPSGFSSGGTKIKSSPPIRMAAARMMAGMTFKQVPFGKIFGRHSDAPDLGPSDPMMQGWINRICRLRLGFIPIPPLLCPPLWTKLAQQRSDISKIEDSSCLLVVLPVK